MIVKDERGQAWAIFVLFLFDYIWQLSAAFTFTLYLFIYLLKAIKCLPVPVYSFPRQIFFRLLIEVYYLIKNRVKSEIL